VIERYVSPEEWRRLLRSLTAVIGVILIFGLFALVVVPGLRNANRPPAQTPVETVTGDSGWLDPTDYPPARGYEIPPLDPQTVMEPTPILLSRGKSLYGQYCVSCHGEAGEGNGQAGLGLKPPPRNFTQPAGWTNGPGRPAIFKTLSLGVPGSAMAAYDILPKKDRMALVQYVRSLARFPEPAESADSLAALAKELAAPGERVPNRIPVSMAERKLIEEYHAPGTLAGALSGVARQTIVDSARVARVLATSDWRQSANALAQVAVAGAPANGFSPSVATLTDAQWQQLFHDLQPQNGETAPLKRPPTQGGASR
jgi:mono/diheme cytochrome c family protein